MKTEMKLVPLDHSLSDVMDGLDNVWWRGDYEWLWKRVTKEALTTVVNKLHIMYFDEGKEYSLERIIEDAVMLVFHLDVYADCIVTIKAAK